MSQLGGHQGATTSVLRCYNFLALQDLQLGNNQIQGLTVEHLSSMPAVSMLDLRDNRLAKLPDEITLLQDLERLDLSNNDLSGSVHYLSLSFYTIENK